MTIRYHTRGGKDLLTYLCQRDGIDNARPICTAIPGHTLDEHVGQLLIATLTPLAPDRRRSIQRRSSGGRRRRRLRR